MRIEKENQKIRNPKSAIRDTRADDFSAQRPSFRATSLLFRKRERTKVKGARSIFSLNFQRPSSNMKE
jgi:hypothetical protein